jgi:hypothetical protein
MGVVLSLVVFLFAKSIANAIDSVAKFGYWIASFTVSVVAFQGYSLRKGQQNRSTRSALRATNLPPVLYLRSFDTEGEAPVNHLNKTKYKLMTIETLAIGEACVLGPVIAIANPLKPSATRHLQLSEVSFL